MARNAKGGIEELLSSLFDRIADRVAERMGTRAPSGGGKGGRKARGGGAKNGRRKGAGRTLDMSCRVEGCKNKSRGPRFGFICDEHRKKLSKKDQAAAREAWNARK